jgi:hypothetical protein
MIFKALKTGGLLWRWRHNVVDDLRQLKPLESATVKPVFIPGYGVMYHVRQPSNRVADAWEWEDTGLVESTVTVTAGQVKYSGALIPSVAPEPMTCDLSTITDGATGCLFVQVDIGAGTVTLVAQDARPVDSPADSIIRVALSLWKRTGTTYERTLILHRGAIQISGIWNQ